MDEIYQWQKDLEYFHLYGKTGKNFSPNGRIQFSSAFFIMEKQVVLVESIMERSFPLEILGSKPREFTSRSMILVCRSSW